MKLNEQAPTRINGHELAFRYFTLPLIPYL